MFYNDVFFFGGFWWGKGDDIRYVKVNYGDEVFCIILFFCWVMWVWCVLVEMFYYLIEMGWLNIYVFWLILWIFDLMVLVFVGKKYLVKVYYSFFVNEE